MPCDVNDIDINLPDPPQLNFISGLGKPFSISLPLNKFQFPNGFPEDLLSIFNKLKLILPSGILQPALNPNFGKDIFDGIMKLLDKFFPFLMLYKFFLPILNLIVCIIEVICSLKNPIKMLRSIRKLFRVCIPDFLSLFPIFALIAMIMSLLKLLLELINYIINQIAKLIALILKNIKALNNAIQKADSESIIAISKKIASLLCIFQNLFVLLSAFSIIFKAIKDILNIKFRIPPCGKDDANSVTEQEYLDGCCNSDVCPDYVLNNTTRSTGTLQYYNQVVAVSNVSVPFPTIPGGPNNISYVIRDQSFQIYDESQSSSERFINIVDAYDIPSFINPKPVFFPTDGTYNTNTAPKQAPYTIDLKLFYNPSIYGRNGVEYGIPRNIIFKDCIVLYAPTTNLNIYDNTTTTISNGVLKIIGGTGYEEDGVTKLYGFDVDGLTATTSKATIENFIFSPISFETNPELASTDGYAYQNVEYTLKPNFEVLFSKDLVSSACNPELRNDIDFVNIVVAGNFNLKLDLLTDLINSNDKFPDLDSTQECLQNSLDVLRSNLNETTLANFQTTTTLCLTDLQNRCNNSLKSLIDIGIDSSKSKFSIDPIVQFTTQKIKVSIDFRDSNNQPITQEISSDLSDYIISKISSNISFGEITKFEYDGSQYFIAYITSNIGGNGTIDLSYDNQSMLNVTLPENLDESVSSTLQLLEYRFIAAGSGHLSDNSNIDVDGKPRRDISDI